VSVATEEARVVHTLLLLSPGSTPQQDCVRRLDAPRRAWSESQKHRFELFSAPMAVVGPTPLLLPRAFGGYGTTVQEATLTCQDTSKNNGAHETVRTAQRGRSSAAPTLQNRCSERHPAAAIWDTCANTGLRRDFPSGTA
jgi:hypothetical protein